jgi:hypothetical protein
VPYEVGVPRKGEGPSKAADDEGAEHDRPAEDTSDVPLMGSTIRRRTGPGSDMRAKRRTS